MARRRRRGREPLWPLALLLGLVAVGLGLSALLPGRLTEEDEAARALEEAGSRPDLPDAANRTRVEVLNGGGIPGMAGRATERLRGEGFDVVYFGNAGSFGVGQSVVLVRTGAEAEAAEVAAALGLTEIRVEPDSTLLVDVTVLIGSDWNPERER